MYAVLAFFERGLTVLGACSVSVFVMSFLWISNLFRSYVWASSCLTLLQSGLFFSSSLRHWRDQVGKFDVSESPRTFTMMVQTLLSRCRRAQT